MTRPDLDAIRARCDAATPGPWRVDGSTYDEDCNEHLAPYGLEGPNERLIWSSGGGEYAHPDMGTAQFIAAARTDIPALLAYIDELQEERNDWREAQEATQVKSDFWRSQFRATYTTGEAEWSQRIATLEHMLGEERENVDTLRARVAELEAEVAVLRPWSVMLKRAHGALTDAGCVVPLEFDQSIEHAINDLARRATRAEQLFVDEYDARKAAEREITELKARITTLEAMKP